MLMWAPPDTDGKASHLQSLHVGLVVVMRERGRELLRARRARGGVAPAWSPENARCRPGRGPFPARRCHAGIGMRLASTVNRRVGSIIEIRHLKFYFKRGKKKSIALPMYLVISPDRRFRRSVEIVLYRIIFIKPLVRVKKKNDRGSPAASFTFQDVHVHWSGRGAALAWRLAALSRHSGGWSPARRLVGPAMPGLAGRLAEGVGAGAEGEGARQCFTFALPPGMS